jgi:hypothetical protein
LVPGAEGQGPRPGFLTRRFAEEYGRYVFGVEEPQAEQALQSSEPRSFSTASDADLEEIGRNDAGPLQMGDRTRDEGRPA